MDKKIIIGMFCIIICLLVPIFSIEGIIPWIMFIAFTKRIVKTIKSDNLTKNILIKCLAYTSLCLLFGVGFNFLIKYGTKFFLQYIL